MTFAEKLKSARRQHCLSQRALAEAAGVHFRTIQNWESGSMPKSLDPVMRIARVLGTTPEEMLGTAKTYVVEANEKGGAEAARDVDALVRDVIGLFAGGEIDDEEKDGIMAAINEAYWIAKQKNTKYTPKKYQKNKE